MSMKSLVLQKDTRLGRSPRIPLPLKAEHWIEHLLRASVAAGSRIYAC